MFRPGQRAQQVLFLLRQASQRLRLLRPRQRVLGLGGQREECREAPLAQHVLFEMALQFVQREPPHRLEEPVAGLEVLAVLHHDQRALYQAREQVEHLELVAVVRADGRGAFERPAAGEHGEPAQQVLFGLQQVVPAPLDHRQHGLLPRRRTRARTRQQLEAVAEPRADLVHAQHAHARRGQLECERDAVHRRQISATSAAFSSLRANAGAAERARSANSRTARCRRLGGGRT